MYLLLYPLGHLLSDAKTHNASCVLAIFHLLSHAKCVKNASRPENARRIWQMRLAKKTHDAF